VNISPSTIDGKCDLKCAYNFKYKDMNNAVVSNGGMILQVENEVRSDLPVLYNQQKYQDVVNLIYYPSARLYNGNLAVAEIIIGHKPENGGNPLFVTIPIKISNDTSNATRIITDLIKGASMSAPKQGEKFTISSFNLQKIVPSKPFYAYSSVYGDYIAFGLLDAIPIRQDTMDTFKKIIVEQKHLTAFAAMEKGSGLYYNSSGPNTTSATLGDGIYISCNPTGNSTETTEVTYEKNASENDMYTTFEDPTFILIIQTLFACLVFIIIFYIWVNLYKFLDDELSVSAIANNADTK